MIREFFKKKPTTRIIVFIIVTQFILGNFSGDLYASTDQLRQSSAKNNSRIEGIKEDLIKESLGNYKIRAVVEDLSEFNYIKHEIDLVNSPYTTTVNLKELFSLQGDPGDNGELYYVLYFYGEAISIVQKDKEGNLNPIPLKENIEILHNIDLNLIFDEGEQARFQEKQKAGQKGFQIDNIVDLLIADYLILERRTAKSVPEQYTLTYKELRQHQEQFIKTEKRMKREIEQLQYEVNGDFTDSQVASLLENIMDAYLKAADRDKESGGDPLSYYSYRKIHMPGGQVFRVKLTQKEKPRVLKTLSGRITEKFEWYIENITEERAGLNPSLTFMEHTPQFIGQLGMYRNLTREQVLDVIFPNRPKPVAPVGEEWEQKRAQLESLEKEYEEFLLTSGLALVGGKGLSLSLTESVVDVPFGVNITTTAYFKFIQDNRNILELIDEELKKLDTMNDQIRDVVSGRIQNAIIAGVIPEDIKDEVLTMYRQINIRRFLAGKEIPAAVAVRSSGIKEDLKLESWLPITTGSQAGQSDTFLNVRGGTKVLKNLKDGWASLFTDRAISYRDDAIFISFSSKIGFEDKQPNVVYDDLKSKLNYYSDKNSNFGIFASTLKKWHNPGSVNLMEAMEEILKFEDNPEIKNSLEVMKRETDPFVNPLKIGIDEVLMQMVKSELAGVLFSVNPATKMAGVSQALYRSWYLDDRSLVHLDEAGEIIGTKPIVASFEISYGYGENVVGGKANPDKFVMVTYNGENWFVVEKDKGNKPLKMVGIEESVSLLKDDLSEDEIEMLAGLVRLAVEYEEIGKKINSALVKDLSGTRYLKELSYKKETEDEKKDRLQKIAEGIAAMIKSKTTVKEIKDFIETQFDVVEEVKARGIKSDILDRLIESLVKEVIQAKTRSDSGYSRLAEYFTVDSGPSTRLASAFISLLKEVWENKELGVTEEDRKEILDKLNLDETQLHNLSYLIRAKIDGRYTCNIETTQAHQDAYCITDSELTHITKMAWDISNYYQDMRDIEFGIEIDPTVSAGKRMEMYILDNKGRPMMMAKDGRLQVIDRPVEELGGRNKVSLRLYNLQARPYTAEYTKVNFVRKRTELDEDFINEKGIKPVASGTKGESATEAYVLAFDVNKSIDEHAKEIKKLKKGSFSDIQKEQLKRAGLDPDDYGEGKKELPVALYLLEADPSHDPLMRLVDAVITVRGGDTCHAAIFCREQGIPAVTAVGKLAIDGELLRTGNWLVVDANNGRIFRFNADPAKRIPIKLIEIMIKPYGIPGNKVKGVVVDSDGFPIPTVSMVLASEKNAQEGTPLMLAADSSGYALTRAEFKGEELGINVFAGYGYDLLRDIEAKTIKRPRRVYLRDIYYKGADKFTQDIVLEIEKYFQNHTQTAKLFRDIFNRDYKKEDGLKLLSAFDVLRDIKTQALNWEALTSEQLKLISFMERADADSVNFLNYLYDALQRHFNFDFNIIEALEKYPWVCREIEEKLRENGYVSFKEFAGKEFYYFYNLMGFTIAPDQKAKNRAYDFAQDKVRGLIGSEIFSWPGVNPLVGLRGASLEIEGVNAESEGNQRILSFLLEAVIEADENTHNQSWFYVFVRFTRELDYLDLILERIAEKKGKLPKQIGIMIEVPSDAILADKLAKKMLELRRKYSKYGVELVFFSFGTNDYSHLAGKGDREDPRMKLIIKDPAALKAVQEMKKNGYLINILKDEEGQDIYQLPLIDEAADAMKQLMEAVVKIADEAGIETGLCGEAVTSLVNRGDYESAGDIMSMLKSFGISMMALRVNASMARFDAMASRKQITVPEDKREILFDLKANGEVYQKRGVVKGEIVFIEKAEDLIASALRGLRGVKLQERRQYLEYQSLESARSTMRTFNKIVVLSSNLIAMTKAEYLNTISSKLFLQLVSEGLIKDIGNGLYIWTNLELKGQEFEEELKARKDLSEKEKNGILSSWYRAYSNTAAGLKNSYIDWEDLEYSLAIIVDSSVNPQGCDLFTKGIISKRVKAKVAGIAGLRKELEGQQVTIDYASGKIYKGDLEVKRIGFEPRPLPIPEHEPQVQIKPAYKENANSVYSGLVYHPLLLLAYEREEAGQEKIEKFVGKIFDEYVEDFVNQIDKLVKETDPKKYEYLLEEFKKKIINEPDPFVREFISGVLDGAVETRVWDDKEGFKAGGLILAEGWLEDLRSKYLESHAEEVGYLKQGIARLIAGRPVRNFIKEAFKQNMLKVLAENKGNFVVHTTTSLNCMDFRNMQGGFLVEQVNPNPNYGLLGAARALGDFWEINRLELEAFKEVRDSLPTDERKNFALQITELKGTQSGALMIGWRYILEQLGIIPGEDGLRIGVNIATPVDNLEINKYFQYFDNFGEGLSFVSYDKVMLAAAWAGVDIYWNQWRRLAREEELVEVADICEKIIKGKIEEANKKGIGAHKEIVVFDTNEIDTLRAKMKIPEFPILGEIKPRLINATDSEVYKEGSLKYDSFAESLRNIKEEGALVLSADTILNNAGAISSLRKIKDYGAIKVALWAEDGVTLAKLARLEFIDLEELADVFSYEGLDGALSELNKLGIANHRTALIISAADAGRINLEKISGLGLKVVSIEATKVEEARINSMPLVVACAIASISRKDPLVTKAYAELVDDYKDNNRIDNSESNRLKDLTSGITQIPLISVSDEIAQAQLSFEEMMDQI